MPRSQHSRRDFLKQSLAAAAASSAIPYFAWSQPAFANAAANDRPRIGCIGLGDQGTGDALQHAVFGRHRGRLRRRRPTCRAGQERPRHRQGQGRRYGDYRKVLDRNDIDVVSIVTPDHWHVKIAIEALQAGKHVFCQKPLTLTLEENQLIRNACKKYATRCSWSARSSGASASLFLRAVNMVQKGIVGRHPARSPSASTAATPADRFPSCAPPKELDWNFWLGQAPKVEYIQQRCH